MRIFQLRILDFPLAMTRLRCQSLVLFRAKWANLGFFLAWEWEGLIWIIMLGKMGGLGMCGFSFLVVLEHLEVGSFWAGLSGV